MSTDPIGILTQGALLLEADAYLKLGQQVHSSTRILSLPVGTHVLGTVLDATGNIITASSVISPTLRWIIESPSSGIITRLTVSESLSSGLLCIDSIVPVGLGQRELIVGDRQTGKTSIAIDTIINQKYTTSFSVYNSIGQKTSNILMLFLTLAKRNALTNTTLLVASASASSVCLYISPYSASSISEYFMVTGELSVFIVYDDLTKQAMSYREIYLLLRRPPGREAYPGEIFFVPSRLLERSAKLNYSVGGGSVSSFPIVETLSGDVSSYITTNVISITDGQIFLSTELFLSGIKPALDVGLSVTRVGSASQWYGMKLVSGSYKLILSQYAELQAFSQFTSEIQDDTRDRLQQGSLLVSLLKQPVGYPIRQDVALTLLSYSNQPSFSIRMTPPKVFPLRSNLSSVPIWTRIYLPSRLLINSIVSLLL